MLVGLISPKQYAFEGNYALNAPLSCATLARRLLDDGIQSEAIDMDGLGAKENWVMNGIDSYDAIGLSCMSSQAEGARRLLLLIKHRYPEKYVVCGGVDVTFEPQKYLDWGADCAVTGEADGNVAEIFRTQPKGIVAGKQGRIDGRPVWEHHMPKPWQYKGHPEPIALPEAMFMAQRGCPWRCAFCANPVNGRKPRRREVDDVVDEIKYLQSNGVKCCFAYDDEFVDHPNLPYALSILEKVPEMLYRCQGRCNCDSQEDKELLRSLTKNGLKRVMWGVESMSQTVLNAITKHTNLDAIQKTLENAKDVGLQNFIFFMSGMPEETWEEATKTYEWAKKAKDDSLIDIIQVMTCVPMRGSDLEIRSKKEGWYFEGHPLNFLVVAGTPWMSQAEIAIHTARMKAL